MARRLLISVLLLLAACSLRAPRYIRFTQIPVLAHDNLKIMGTIEAPVMDLTKGDTDVSNDGIHWHHYSGIISKSCPKWRN